MRLMEALQAWVFEPALAAHRRTVDADIRQRAGQATAVLPDSASTRVRSAATRAGRDRVFDRPVFIVCPPRSGSTLLFETMAQSPDVYTIGDESHQLIEGVPTLAPAARGFESNRLAAVDATPEVVGELRRSFFAALHDRAQRRPDADRPVRMLEKTPKNALRVPFLARVFPEARFIYLHRDPRPVLASMIEAWGSGRFRTYPNLPGWTGLPWSLLLVPGWRDLLGQPLHEIVATQWNTTTRLLLDDLEQLPPDSWTVANYEALRGGSGSRIASLVCSQ